MWGDDSRKGPEPEPAPPDERVDTKTPPLDQLNAMPAESFFDRALALLEVHPPHATDWSLVARMARIGLVAGASFDGLDKEVRAALENVPADARAVVGRTLPQLANVVNGWQLNVDTMGVYGNSYVKRAIVAMVGLGANSAEDAIYPLLQTDGEGHRVTGDADYVIHFDAGRLPPVDAFWSITMYDGQGFQVANVRPVRHRRPRRSDVQRRRLPRPLPATELTRGGQGVQLASGTGGPDRGDHAALRAEDGRTRRNVGTPAGHPRR
jgi:hypothetical protein